MAKKVSEMYPARVDIGDPVGWPGGRTRNVISGVSNSGTPLEEQWENEIESFPQAIMKRSKTEYDGAGANAVDNPYLDGIEKLVGAHLTCPEPSIDELCSGHIGQAYHDPSADQNHIRPLDVAGPLYSTIVDACVGRRVAPRAHLPALYFLDTQSRVRRLTWSRDGIDTETPQLSLSYPSPMNRCSGICCDGSALYVAWVRSADDHYMVSKYQINPLVGSPLWNYDSGELAPTTALEEYAKLTVADAGNVALSLIIDTGGGGALATGVSIIDKATGSGTKGSGFGGTSIDVAPRNGRIVSDGIHVFWMVNTGWSLSGAHDTELHSARIEDPTTSDYTPRLVATVDRATDPQGFPSGIVAAGKEIVMSAPSGKIYKLNKGAGVAHAVTIANCSDRLTTTTYASALGFDRSNIWFMGVNPEYSLEACKLPAGLFTSYSVAPESFQANKVGFRDTVNIDADAELGRLLFTGSDMWMVHRTDGIYRIMNPVAK